MPTSGSTRATPTNDARGPTPQMSNGASTDPSASPAIDSPSTSPKTRPSTSAGTMRWISVRVATSKNTRPAPTSASSTQTRHGGRHDGQHAERAAEHRHRRDDRQGEPSHSEHRRRDHAGDEAARADGGVQVADPTGAGFEDPEREDDEQDVERADDDPRPGLEPEEQPRGVALPRRGEADRQLPAERQRSFADGGEALRPSRRECTERRDRREGGSDADPRACAEGTDDDAGGDTCEDNPDALDPPERRVAGTELLDAVHHPREQGRLRRARRHDAGRCNNREEPHEHGRSQGGGNCRRGERSGLEHIAADQQRRRRAPVGDRRDERRNDRCRDELRERNRATLH